MLYREWQQISDCGSTPSRYLYQAKKLDNPSFCGYIFNLRKSFNVSIEKDYQKGEILLTFPANPFPLSGSKNTRELGGCPIPSGCFPLGRFWRSDLPEKLTKEEELFFQDSSLCCVIDLRSEMEIEMEPCALKVLPGIDYLNVPLSDHIHTTDSSTQFPKNMGEMYIGLLENHKAFQEIFHTILTHPNGLILFHCKAGKDRTGILSMLLLKLSGAGDQEVIADYLKSDECLKWQLAKSQLENKLKISIPEFVFRAEEHSIKQALAYLKERYSSVEGYLKELEFSNEDILALKQQVGN